MKFSAALTLVFSKRRRLEHGAWDSWAVDRIAEINRLAEIRDSARVASGSVSIHTENARGAHQKDLRDEYAEFINGGGQQ
jgi:hypothetical protein